MAIPLDLPVFDPVTEWKSALAWVDGLTVGRSEDPYGPEEIKAMSGQADIRKKAVGID